MRPDPQFLSALPQLTFYRGRVALYAILKALGVGSGDEVVTQAFTCSAVPEAILATGATPVWADTEQGGVNASVGTFEPVISPQCRAIIVQHTFGIPTDMRDVMPLAEKHGLPVIEDCCHTLASGIGEELVGTWGIGSFTSYEWGKPVVCGLGGSAIVRDAELHAKVNHLWNTLPEPGSVRMMKVDLQYAAFKAMYKPRNYWRLKRAFRRLASSGLAEGNYAPVGEGSKGFAMRMTQPMCERLKGVLANLDSIIDHQVWAGQLYAGRIHSQNLTNVRVPAGSRVVYGRYPLIATNKQALLAAAMEAGIEVADWYTSPIQPLGPRDWPKVGYKSGSCPHAEALSQSLVSLPTNQKVSDSDIERTVELMNGF